MALRIASLNPAVAIHWCRECGGEGEIYLSTNPHARPVFCAQCDGSGNESCEECGEEYATNIWQERGREYLLCQACWDQWAEDAAA